jgi:hypothetical protein
MDPPGRIIVRILRSLKIYISAGDYNLKGCRIRFIIIDTEVFMSIQSYLETLPLSKVIKYIGGIPKEGIPFMGYPRQHPSEKQKMILLYDPLGKNPAILEFKLDDILHVQDLPSAVTESGEGIPLIKLWVRKGARGVILEPFEVDDPIRFVKKQEELKEHFEEVPIR